MLFPPFQYFHLERPTIIKVLKQDSFIQNLLLIVHLINLPEIRKTMTFFQIFSRLHFFFYLILKLPSAQLLDHDFVSTAHFQVKNQKQPFFSWLSVIGYHEFVGRSYYINKMIGLIFAILLVAGDAQETAILLSDFSTTKIVAGFSSVNDRGAYMNISYLEEDPIGNGSRWVYPREYFGSPLLKPAGFTITYQALFYSVCSLKAGVLRVAASSQFTAYLDGKEVARGEGWSSLTAASVSLNCGLSNLTVVVTTTQRGPCAVTFSVSQDQTKCFECSDPRLPFYNQNTCKCECSNLLNNSTCGLKCPSSTNSCNSTQIFNAKTCKCECKKAVCPQSFIQDPSTCRVMKKECKIRRCVQGFYWNSQECQCLINPCRPVSQPLCKNGFSYFICSCIEFTQRSTYTATSTPTPPPVSVVRSSDAISSECTKLTCSFPFVWSESSCVCRNLLISTNNQT